VDKSTGAGLNLLVPQDRNRTPLGAL